MNNNNKFYVYAHYRNDTNKIFYIGKGHDNRAYDKNIRSKHWKNVVNKHGYIIKLIDVNLCEEQAFELEIFLIQELGRLNLGTGLLINLTDGGDGSTGWICSEETRKKRSISIKQSLIDPEIRKKISDNVKKAYENDPEIRKKMSDRVKKAYEDPELRWKMRLLNIGENNPMYGKTHTTKNCEIFSKAQTGEGNSQFGTMWITNGIENKKIKKDETIPEGYYNGRVCKKIS